MILILQVGYIARQIWLASQNFGFRNQENQLMSLDGVCVISAGLAGDVTISYQYIKSLYKETSLCTLWIT